jgi:hypothetical protein
MSPIVWTYLTYLVVSLLVTLWVGRTLHHNGRIFLVDVFSGNAPLADSINHLLVVGFYLINFGYVVLALKEGSAPRDLREVIETLSNKVGIVLLVLGGMHFFNLLVFSRMRRRAMLHTMPPPVQPQAKVSVVTP